MNDDSRPCTPQELLEINARMIGGHLQHGTGIPDESRAFACKECSKRYVPLTSQWIFYDLCDECFIHFDKERMAERIANSPLAYLTEGGKL